MTDTKIQGDPAGRAVVESFFRKLGHENDIDGWLALIAEDVVVESPFARAGRTNRTEGRQQVDERFGGVRRGMRSMEFLDITILATEDPELWVATCRSEAVQTNGTPYGNIYCWMFRVQNERLVWWREYADPQRLAAIPIQS